MSGSPAAPTHVWVHGARREVHDFHVGEAGAFATLMEKLGELRREDVPCIASTVLTRSNQAVIGEVPAFLTGRGVRAWRVVVPAIAAGSAPECASAHPRLALALPYALHALSRAERSGLEVYISGAPLCLLGPFASRAVPSAARAHGPPCEGCPGRSACPGVDARYLEQFAGDELRPREAPGRPPGAAKRWLGAILAAGEGSVRGSRPGAGLGAETGLPIVP